MSQNTAPIEVYDLLVPVVASLDKTLTPTSVQDMGDGTYKVFTRDTLWLTLKYPISISSVDYTVEDLEPNAWVLISGASAPAASSFQIYSPFFAAATMIQQNKDFSSEIDWKKKLPLIWLHDVVRERFIKDPESSIERTAQCDLYFLADANSKDWTNAQHRKYAIMPMRNLLFKLVMAMEAYAYILDPLEDFDVLDHARFGLYSDKGHEKRIIDGDLSGTQFSGGISFLKKFGCAS